MKHVTTLAAVLALCGAASAAELAVYDTYDVGTVLSYPFDFEVKPKGTVAGDCIDWAQMDVVGASVPGSPAYNQWSAVGFDDGGSFVYEIMSREECPLNPGMNACFDPDLLYAGGIRRSTTGPTNCTVTISWIDCGSTELESATLDSFTVTTSYANFLYDLDLVAGLGDEDNGCVEYLKVEWYATGATSALGTFRIGNYYDGSYYDFGITGECCCIPEPGTVALLALGGLAGLVRRFRG